MNQVIFLQTKKQLIDLRNDQIFKMLFTQELDEFDRPASKSFSMIAANAIEIILLFASLWLTELGFSVLGEIKSCKRENYLSTRQCRFSRICTIVTIAVCQLPCSH